ncbi:hypothetical protein F2P45_29185 [Massilia sp. CCM 8733]|uniref:TonB C-terminal domain-containing protein n=1 Tax=Massilia mucilaginosa TaxID=2609282 RepID=A0ABX0P1E6_9BURK|nr:TonB C-terminal domain-containing protein [Massilia mucilaginosa]NHZ93052.1 hypothetical protein [Massilia mucilaginosa]
MPRTPAFLVRLGLDTTADERAIRRAYARLLKQIDQETEPARFQALREDYEQAIAWLSRREADDHADEDENIVHEDAAGASAAPAPVRSSDLFERIDPDALADEVYQEFLAALPELRSGPMQADVIAWSNALRRCLDHQRLLNIAAGAAFEARIAALLAGPRQPGHETLFSAAIEVFGWVSGRHRLRQFHRAGALLDRAIDERDMFNAQESRERLAQQQALAMLALPDLPHADTLRRLAPHVEMMMARFPVLMRIVADQDSLDRWRAGAAALSAERVRLTAIVSARAQLPADAARHGHASTVSDRARAYLKDKMAGPLPAILAGLLIIFAALWWHSAQSVAPTHYTPPADHAAPLNPSGQQGNASSRIRMAWPDFFMAMPASRPQSKLMTRKQLDAIGAHFNYTVEKHTPLGRRSIDLDIHLDQDSKIKSMTIARSSGYRDFDDAVEKALRDAQPFPASAARSFKMIYITNVTQQHLPKEPVGPLPQS